MTDGDVVGPGVDQLDRWRGRWVCGWTMVGLFRSLTSQSQSIGEAVLLVEAVMVGVVVGVECGKVVVGHDSS